MVKLSEIIKGKVARNAGWLIGGNIAQKVLAFVVSILMARYLGPSNYGLINYATAYTTFFFHLSQLGLTSTIVKNLLDRPEQEGATLGTTLVLQCLTSLVSIAAIVVIVFFVDHGEKQTIAVVFLCSLSLFFQMLGTIDGWFQAKLKSKYSAIATTVAYIITSAYRIALLIMGKSVEWFAVASSVDYLCVAVMLFITYKRENGPRLCFSTARGKEMLSKSYHYIFSGLMVAVYSATDKLMLKQMLDESAVGYYGTAVSITNIWVFVLGAIISSLNPVIMELFRSDKKAFDQKNRQLYAIVFYCSVFVSLFMVILAKPGIRILYGDAFLPAASQLRIVTWYVAFAYLGVARDAWIVCEEKQKYLTRLYFGAAVTNVVLNALLIPALGADGAAWASLITQISTILVFPSLIKALRPNVKLMIDAFLLRNLK